MTGGVVTDIEDLYVLVSLLQSTQPINIDLGSYDVTNLESVTFHLGVDEEANHADPSLLPWTHPLAPKFPSMHWGWAAGYRFIALEGKSGANIDQDIQFHCIGNEYYTKMEFPVSMSGQDNFVVTLDAEYNSLLSGIDISSGLILHGGQGEILTLAENFKENVFTVSSVTSTADSDLIKSLAVYPNPAPAGKIHIALEVASADNTIRVQDALGRVICTAAHSGLTEVEVAEPGIYFISVVGHSGNVLATRKIVVQ